MNEMYGIIKNVINGKAYELTTMLTKIKTLWVEGDISDAQKEELVELARENAKPENSYAPLQNQINTLFANVKELAQEILTLKNGGTLPEEPTEEYPPYVQPTGAHDVYHNGDGITYTDGIQYDCIAPVGVAVVWPPDVMPSYWKARTETE